jgi:hypothetical protein
MEPLEEPLDKAAKAPWRPVRKVSAINDLRKLSKRSSLDAINELEVIGSGEDVPKKAEYERPVNASQQHGGDSASSKNADLESGDSQHPKDPTPSPRFKIDFGDIKVSPPRTGTGMGPQLSSRPVSADAHTPKAACLPAPMQPTTPEYKSSAQFLTAERFQSPNHAPIRRRSRSARDSRDSGYYSIARASIGESPKGPIQPRLDNSPWNPQSDRRKSPVPEEHQMPSQATIPSVMSSAELSAKKVLRPSERIVGRTLTGRMSSLSIQDVGRQYTRPSLNRYESLLEDANETAAPKYASDLLTYNRHRRVPWDVYARPHMGAPATLYSNYQHKLEHFNNPSMPPFYKRDTNLADDPFHSPVSPLANTPSLRVDGSVSSEDSDSTEPTAIWLSDDSEFERSAILPDNHPYLQVKDILVYVLVKKFLEWHRSVPATSRTAAAPPPPPPPPSQDKKGDSSKKRSRQVKENSNKRDGDSQESLTVSRKRTRITQHAVTFACPFLKKNHRRHGACGGKVLSRIQDVKQHLARCHRMPIYCGRCGGVFRSEAARDEHLQEDERCTKQKPEHDGITADQLAQLAKKSDSSLSREQQWYFIFDLLFPGHQPRPDSPFLNESLRQALMHAEELAYRLAPDAIQNTLRMTPPAELSGLNEERDRATLLNQIVREVLRRVFNTLTNRTHNSASTSVDSGNSREQHTPSSESVYGLDHGRDGTVQAVEEAGARDISSRHEENWNGTLDDCLWTETANVLAVNEEDIVRGALATQANFISPNFRLDAEENAEWTDDLFYC